MLPQNSLVHPELQIKLPRVAFTARNLRLMRLLIRAQRPARLPDDVRVENIVIPGAAEQARLRLRVYRPRSTSAPAPVLMWLHGGGFIMGRPEIDDALCGEYAHTLGPPVLTVDYRLAPEFPCPAAVEDAATAYRWLLRSGFSATRPRCASTASRPTKA